MQQLIYNSHKEQLTNLIKAINLHSGFSLLIAEFNRYTYRDMLIAEIDKSFKDSVILEITGNMFPGFTGFENHLANLSKQFSVIHIINKQGWLYSDKWPELFKGLNYHREKIAGENPVSIILWLLSADVREFALRAPDMWHWRSGVFHFMIPGQDLVAPVEEEDIQPRINEILDYLKEHPGAGESANVLLFQELAELYSRLGDYDNADKYLSIELEILKKQRVKKDKGILYKILVVNDEPAYKFLIRQSFKKQIRGREWQFIFARDGREAREKLEKTPGIIAVIIDPAISKMNELISFKEFDAVKNPVSKVLMDTDPTDIDNIRSDGNRGDFDFLIKPTDFKALEIALLKAIKRVELVKGGGKEKNVS